MECVNGICGTARKESAFAIDGTSVRADGDWIVDGKRILWDNACVDPLAVSAPRGMLKTAARAEHGKRVMYDQRAKDVGAEFIPLVVETTGGFGGELQKFVKRLRVIAHKKMSMLDPNEHIESFQDGIACLLARHNSWIAQRGNAHYDRCYSNRDDFD